MKNGHKKDPQEKFSIRTFRNFEELEEIRAFWEKMQWFPNADIDFYLTLASLNPGFVRPHVILLSQGGQPVALLIGRIQDAPLDFKIGYKSLQKRRVRSLEVIYGGTLGDLSYSNSIALIEELMQSLRRAEADVVFLKMFRCDSPIYQVAKQRPSFLCRDHYPSPSPHWTMTMPKSFDEFYGQLSKSTKKTNRLITNRMKKSFGDDWSIRCFRKTDEIELAMRDTETVAAKTYQRGMQAGFPNTSLTRKQWSFAADREWLLAYVLYIKEAPCAFWNGYIYKNIFIPTATGYDPVYRYYDPGMFLFLRMVEDLCLNNGIKLIDFGFGEAEYKRNYCDQKWEEASIYIFAPTFSGVTLNFLRSSTALLSRLAKALLERFNILQNVKRRWRDKLRSK